MRKHLHLLTGLLILAGTASAQFRFQSNEGIGQTYRDTLGSYSFLVHFNTNRPVSSYTESAVSISKCQTQRGLQVKVYPDATSTAAEVAGDFKCDNYGSNGNPVHVASTDSLINIMKKYTALNASTADTARNQYWKPAACLFDVVAGDNSNQAFGCYPGQYKRVEYGFQFNLSGLAPTTDLSFTIDTYDPGNTGLTASYDLIVYLGSVSSANALDTVKDFYVTGSGKKAVKLAKELGIDSALFNTKVYIHIVTKGTDSPISRDTYDPIIVFDDFYIEWSAPEWLSPAVTSGVIFNQTGGNFSPYTVKDGIGYVQVYLKDKERVAPLTIINDVEFPPSQYQFLDSDGVFANDGAGNYTVPVTYTVTRSTLNQETGNFTKSYLTIPAPEGKTDDDLMVLMSFTPKAGGFTERIEVNNGVRFWWDVQTAPYVGIDKTPRGTFEVFSHDGTLYLKGATQPVTLYNGLGQFYGTYAPETVAKGLNVPSGWWFIRTSEGHAKVMVR